jgi:tRNA(Ile)-lysidine synthase
MLLDDLAASLREAGLAPGGLCVLGFSGGPDSAALLHAVQAAGWRPLVAHLDHGLRPESAAQAKQADAVAAAYGLAFVMERADVAGRAQSEGQSIEEAARAARYEFLFRLARERNAQAVLVAHTADDQAETILMHLLRGAGAAGLRGMPLRLLPNPWSDTIPLVRPVLGASRAEVLVYCAEHNLQTLHDPSNDDPAYFRNMLRHEVLPGLEQAAPGFKRRLLQTSELLAADQALIEQLAGQAWRRCLAQRGAGFVGLQRTALAAEPLALQRGVLRRAAAELRRAARDVGYAQIEQARAALMDSNSRRQDWFGGLVIMAEGEMLWLAERAAELPEPWPQAPEDAVHVEAPGSLQLNAGWRLELSEASAPPAPGENNDRYQTWLNLEAAGAELCVRRPRPGDRVAPLGMGGTQKLSDLFINAKLPRRARAAWPLVCRGDEIIWVPGYCLAEAYAVRGELGAVLRAKLVKGG